MECLVFISPILCFIYILFFFFICFLLSFLRVSSFFLLSLFHILQINSRVAFIINLNLYFLTLSLSFSPSSIRYMTPLSLPRLTNLSLFIVSTAIVLPPPLPPSFPLKGLFFSYYDYYFFLDYLQASLGCSLYSVTVEKKKK